MNKQIFYTHTLTNTCLDGCVCLCTYTYNINTVGTLGCLQVQPLEALGSPDSFLHCRVRHDVSEGKGRKGRVSMGVMTDGEQRFSMHVIYLFGPTS